MDKLNRLIQKMKIQMVLKDIKNKQMQSNKSLKLEKQLSKLYPLQQKKFSNILHISWTNPSHQDNKLHYCNKFMPLTDNINKKFRHQSKNLLSLELNYCKLYIFDSAQNQQNLLKQKQNDKHSFQMKQEIQSIIQKGKQRDLKIENITELNENQTELFNLTKQNITENMEVLKKQITQFYQKSVKSTLNNNEMLNKFQIQIQSQGKKINYQNQQLQQAKNLTILYASQREEIRSHLLAAIELKNNAVTRQEYQRDRKYHKIENQLTKKQISKIMNEALTPEIRSFLPTLIQNIQLLKKLQKQIKQFDLQINISRQAENFLKEKLLKFQYSTKKNIQERQIQTKKLSMQLDRKFLSLNQQFKQKIELSILKEQQMQHQIKVNKQQSDQKIQNFVEQNGQKIYLAVLSYKPPEVRQEEQRLKNKIYGFEGKMQQVQKNVVQRCDNVLTLGNNLQTKLELFQNRITKAKSDLKVENDNMKKIIQALGIKMTQSQNKNHQQSQVISKILQICMINSALQIDAEYLNFSGKYGEQNNQSFISFHDGIIYEINNDLKQSEAVYRKKKVNKQLLKRVILTEQAKLIDFITQKLKNWKWADQKERPSQFFSEIVYPAYEKLLSDKKQVIQARKLYLGDEKSTNINKDQSSKVLSPKRSRQTIHNQKSSSKIQSINLKNISKTPGTNQQKNVNNISLDSGRGTSLGDRIFQQTNNTHTQMFTTVDFKRPNRIKLKKHDTKDKQSLPKINRYPSINKQTI